MKTFLIISTLVACATLSHAQGPQAYFNAAANHYVNQRSQQAINSIQEGIRKYPNDPKLKALGDKLKEEQKKQEEEKKEQEKKDQQQKEQEKKDQQQQQKGQQNKDQQNKDQQDQEAKDKKEQQDQEAKDKKEQQQKDQQQQEQKESDKDNQDKKDISPDVARKLEGMKISPEKAKMILEAMKTQEQQYLQQNKRKATKPRDKGKPDW